MTLGDERSTVGAAVDLGSNSVHLLVAAVVAHRLQVIVDESEFMGLGDAVAERGSLGAARRAELAATLVRYAEAARRLGASEITFLGTEPIRRAADAPAIVHEVEAASGTPLFLLTHEEEAFLTLIGVSEGMPVTHEMLVVDVGGGSSEFCVVGAGRPAEATGLRVGSATLTRQLVNHDPPTPGEIQAMRSAALEAVRGAPDAHPTEIVAVGGTASNLAKLLPAAAIDRTLTRDRIAEVERILGSEPAAAAAERHQLNPVRARVLPAGGAIMDAILDRYGADRIRVSDAGIREGAVLARAHGGSGWRDRLPDLTHGWRG